MQSLYTNMTYSFLTKLINTSLNADIESIHDMGVTVEQVEMISSLPHGDLYKLSRIYQLIDIHVDVTLLDKAISLAKNGIRNIGDVQDMDITHKLLRTLSTLSADETEIDNLTQKFEIPLRNVRELAAMTLQDTLAIARTGIVWYEITANEIKLPMALEYIIESQREAEAIKQLIVKDASWPMVHALTGMGKAAFQEMRKSLNAPKTMGGPPRRLSDDEEVLVWNAWNTSTGKYPLERCLEVSKTLNDIALRHLWPTLSAWLENESNPKVKSIA
ncbi:MULTISPECIES: STY4526/YPO1902 family pathogenicity island replication protein [unclassified Methylophaga]|uniref:STY4526/YPO1902 family pathogenicity island replication protein n=1 Tax=unclassified Methylophaga TaxID=2629249 RepID=UPI0023B49607|nr:MULTISPECIES: STY4526/YPO1902 family pathogenicity island replication protein [unclassified Methylophaga]